MNDEVSTLRKRLQDLHDAHTTGFVDDENYAKSLAYLERQLVDAVMRAETAGPAAAPAQATGAVPAATAGLAEPAAEPGRRRGWVVGVLTVAVLGVAGSTWLAMRKPGAQRVADTRAAATTASAPAVPASAEPASAVLAVSQPASAAGTSISGLVTLAPALKDRAAPGDTVFVYARAVEGPPMPLAVLRRQVKDLPLQFSFDDSMAMWPAAKVSAFPRVVVTARVSKSGEGTARRGDLEGHSPEVAAGASGLSISIASVVEK